MPTVVLTGATGFLGGRVAAALLARGTAVIALVRSGAAGERAHARLAGPLRTVVTITPAMVATALEGALAATAAGSEDIVVIHAAACYGRRGEPDAALHEANVELPSVLLAWAKARRAAGFVAADTVLATGAGRYAASKACGRAALQALAADAALPVVDLRLEHLYGPGDDADRFVPWLARQCANPGETVPLSSGRQRREFVHVDDAAAACLCLVDALPRLPAGWQATRVSGDEVSVRALAETVHALSAGRAALGFGLRPDRPAETDPAAPDDSLLRRCGWRRHIALADGLRATLTEAFP